MAKRRMGILAILLCLCLCLCWLPAKVWATSTADATEMIRPDSRCTLSVFYGYGDLSFDGVSVNLYKIADVSADFQYTLTPSFADSGVLLNGVQTAGEWSQIRATLESHVLANEILPTLVDTTDHLGRAAFTDLETGMYLAIAENVLQDDWIYTFDPALIPLPALGADGTWNYTVEVASKSQGIPPIEPDEQLELSVVKLWKGDSGYKGRPQSVEVELFRNGVSYQTVTLSQANQWSYTWTEQDAGAKWMVVERNVPQGYQSALTQRGTNFVLTNTLDPDIPPQSNRPATGDTANPLLYTMLLYLSGIMLIFLGIYRKRKGV